MGKVKNKDRKEVMYKWYSDCIGTQRSNQICLRAVN